MRAIILAAGYARRLQPLTNHTPKCLLPIGEETILGRNLKVLSEHKWSEIVIVNGFCGEHIENFVRQFFPSLPVTFKINQDFEKTNNAYSLKLGLASHNSPFVLFDGDLLFDAKILSDLLQDKRDNLMVVDGDLSRLNAESMKVKLGAEGAIKGLLKSYSVEESGGEYIGMARFGKIWTQKILEVLETMTEKEFETAYYEDAINKLISQSPPLQILPTQNRFWSEIDTPEDLAIVKAVIASTRRVRGNP